MRPEDLESLAGGKLPVLFINSIHPNHSGSVILEDERGMRLATEHLIGLGHRRIGLISGLPQSDTAVRRGLGFRGAMHDAGLPIPADYVTSLGYNPPEGRAALAVLAALPEPPTAVVVANVNAALGALLEARIRGLRVPEDLSIVAMHDAWPAEYVMAPSHDGADAALRTRKAGNGGDLRSHHRGHCDRHGGARSCA